MQLPKYQRLVVRQRMLTLIRPERLVGQMDKEITEYAFMFRVLGPLLLEKIPILVREGHIKSLAKSLIAEPRVEGYRLLNWFVYKSGETLILGDVGCLFEISGSQKLKSLNDKEDELRNVYLPISSDTLVLGTTSSSMPYVDSKRINENSAKCSRDFFVCQEASREMSDLQALLSSQAEILSKQEIVSLLAEVIIEG